jgi:fumarate hydratase class II
MAAAPAPLTVAMRVEHDSIGDIGVPADAKWATQTQRAVQNFPISGLTVDRSLIAALARL